MMQERKQTIARGMTLSRLEQMCSITLMDRLALDRKKYNLYLDIQTEYMGIDAGRYGGWSMWKSFIASTSSMKSEACSLVEIEIGREGGNKFQREKKV